MPQGKCTCSWGNTGTSNSVCPEMNSALSQRLGIMSNSDHLSTSLMTNSHWVLPTTCQEFKFLFMFSICRSANEAAGLTNLDYFKDSLPFTTTSNQMVLFEISIGSYYTLPSNHMSMVFNHLSNFSKLFPDNSRNSPSHCPHSCLPDCLILFKPFRILQPLEDLPLSEMCKDPLLSFQDSSLGSF